jgi:fructokinase
VPALWAAHVFAAGAGDAPRTRLVPSLHGDASGVRGAARLWREPPTSAGTGARSCG